MNKLVISECLKLYRSNRGLGIRECAKEIGISSATLSRIENGKHCDMNSFTKLLTWLMKFEVNANKVYVKRL
jgi:transcriptional regulator with XRE-family HTH domain